MYLTTQQRSAPETLIANRHAAYMQFTVMQFTVIGRIRYRLCDIP